MAALKSGRYRSSNRLPPGILTKTFTFLATRWYVNGLCNIQNLLKHFIGWDQCPRHRREGNGVLSGLQSENSDHICALLFKSMSESSIMSLTGHPSPRREMESTSRQGRSGRLVPSFCVRHGPLTPGPFSGPRFHSSSLSYGLRGGRKPGPQLHDQIQSKYGKQF